MVYFGKRLLPVDAEPHLAEMVSYAFRVLDAVGIRNGSVHLEIKAEARGPVLIEANCRLHGGEGTWAPMAEARLGRLGGRGDRGRGSKIGKFCKFFAKFCKFLAGSFSAVSKRNFATKYAFDSIFQALQDLHTFAPLQSQNFSKKLV